MKKDNKKRVEELIREGKNYKETKETLEKESGDTLAGATYYRLKETIYPKDKVDAALDTAREKREKREGGKQEKQRRAKWSTGKQKNADESKLAELINTGMYHGVLPFCKNKALKVEDVKEVNLGGAVVSSILYYFPDVNLDHPLIVLATRGILFYIRFRQVCSTINEKIEEVKQTLSGIKPEWKK